MAQAISTGTFCEAKWLVDPTAGQGTHTTIATALTSASSGDTIFIRPGTYVENLTLKVGVNLSAFECDALTPNVTLSGTATLTAAGTVSISGIRLQTNSAALLAVTGSAASIVNLTNCYLNCSNNTGITFSAANVAAAINLDECRGDLGTTGIGLFTNTSTGIMTFKGCFISNSGASTTSSTISAGNIIFYFTSIFFPITTSSTAGIALNWVNHNTSTQNTTSLTINGSGNNRSGDSIFFSGSATAITVTSNSFTLVDAEVNSTNTNAISGAGTINIGNIVFSGTSNKISTTTQVLFVASDFQKIVRQVFTSNGTYTPTSGMKYCDIEVVSSGGGGGATTSTGATTVSAGGGGGGGGYARGIFSAATIGASQAVTVGVAGIAGAVAGGAGGNGNTSSVGALLSATGGAGGSGSTAGGSVSITGGTGGTGTGGDFQTKGAPGGGGIGAVSTGIFSFALSGIGGSSYYGGGAQTVSSGVGLTATSYGGGGSGSAINISATQQAGGAGFAGIVVITEYV